MRPADLGEVLSAVPSLMDGFPAPWFVAGGWAIDLFLGRVTRPHGDVELAIFRQDQSLLHKQFPGWAFRKVLAGKFTEWRVDEHLSLPVHEIHARAGEGPPLKLEFLLNERADNEWVFRRDPSVRLALDRAVQRVDGGFPILNPAIVLLFKSKGPRTKDESDFHSTRESLNKDDRQWLRAALQVCHPEHPWLTHLDAL